MLVFKANCHVYFFGLNFWCPRHQEHNNQLELTSTWKFISEINWSYITSQLVKLTLIGQQEFWEHDITIKNNLLRILSKKKLTPIKNPTNGKRVRPRKAKASSWGGRFSGALKMWVISALGPYLEEGSTASGGGRGAFSGASGRSSSTWPTARKKEFSWNTTNLLGLSKKIQIDKLWDKKAKLTITASPTVSSMSYLPER